MPDSTPPQPLPIEGRGFSRHPAAGRRDLLRAPPFLQPPFYVPLWFFHEPTFTASAMWSCCDRSRRGQTKRAAIIDSVWDFDQPSGRTSFEAADEIVAYVRSKG
jgi:hypothetical protein